MCVHVGGRASVCVCEGGVKVEVNSTGHARTYCYCNTTVLLVILACPTWENKLLQQPFHKAPQTTRCHSLTKR